MVLVDHMSVLVFLQFFLMGKKVLAVVILETFFCNFVLFSVKINV